MESKRKTYLIIVNLEGDEIDKGPYFNAVANRFINTTAVAATVKKAYRLALEMSDISESDSTYRKVADSIRLSGVAFIGEKGDGSNKPHAIITRVNAY